MTNWSKRLTELQAQYGSKPISDKAFFESDEYQEFTRKAAEDMVNGICGYLRRLGFSITEAEEDKRVKSIRMLVQYDESSNMTAATDGDYVFINAGNTLLKPLAERELKHFAVQGFRVHEIGHVIFSDFPTKMAWQNQLRIGQWWPAMPQRLSTPEGAALDAKLKNDENYRDILMQIARNVENALEDGYIEREIQTLYGGLAATELATLNDMLLENAKSLGTQLQNGVKPFFALLNQLLLYAKFDLMFADDCPEEYEQLLEDCIFVIDDIKCERDPQKRVAGVNEILCVLYPLLDETVQDMQREQGGQRNPQPQAGQNGQNGQNSKSNPQMSGSGPAQSQPMTQQQLEGLAKALGEAVEKSGASNVPENQKTGSLANPNRAKNSGAVDKAAAGKTAPHGDLANMPGASLGEADLSAGQWEVSKILKSAANAAAHEQVERELKKELQQEAKGISGAAVKIDRAADVTAQNIAEYEKLAGMVTTVSRNIERRFRTLIRDEENDDTISGLTMGTKLEARQLYHRDGKCFSRKNFPRDTPRLAIGYLADESASMSWNAIDASIRTGIILEDLCRRMELPCYIGGFTSASDGCQYLSYVEYGSVDTKDKYRLTGMSSRGGTPTGIAVEYMAGKLKKLQTAHKLLIVSTDGRSNSKEFLQQKIREAKKVGISVIGAGIGEAREQIQEEFGDAFLDVSDMEKMPQLLANIVKRYLLR